MSDAKSIIPLERKIFFNKVFDQESCSSLSKSIIDINDSDFLLKKHYAIDDLIYTPKPIEIYIDSYGGNVYQCLGVISIIEKSETPIHTIVTGTAMSCGFMLAISGHRRFAYKYSTLMYHQISNMLWGEIKHIQENLKQTEKLQSIFENIVLEKTKIKKKTLKEVFDTKTDWYMSSEEALQLNCIDEII